MHVYFGTHGADDAISNCFECSEVGCPGGQFARVFNLVAISHEMDTIGIFDIDVCVSDYVVL